VCSGVAYLLYYRLIADVGPTRAMTVTFLMPAFGLIWSVAFLAETVTLAMIAGAALIVAGTAAVLRPAEVNRPAGA
jgi:drug/metabolite transporter (DMT)-like permease